MPRIIEFRAKDRGNGYWLFGYPYQTQDGKWVMKCGATGPYFIDPDTLGQFTGMYDREQNGISEGDLMEYFGEIYLVVFKDGCFGYQGQEFIPMCEIDTKADLKVGNIHDNPDLWEKK